MAKYLSSFSLDPWQLKVFVALIWALDLAHTIVVAIATYTALIVHDNDAVDANSPTSFLIAISGVASVLITSLTQCYFSFRLYRLSGSKTISSLSAVLAVSRIFLYSAQLIARFVWNGGESRTWIWSIFTCKTISILCDFLVAGSISIILLRRRKAILLRPSEIVNRIMIIAIEANMFTCAVMIVSTTAYSTTETVSLGVSLVTCKLFFSTFMMSLFWGRKLAKMEVPIPDIRVDMEEQYRPSFISG
ncbi:hypothetical protein HYPSUDRAFT_43080 [Hypholoma sublateritium FD-334 SS-4]|uniref:DUF6534 domain-containing protein n=1 Tax=Hypholoma sublateritium (strain FD-334 SS-4) TaxID=945553 RepID=A0A0D2NP42_HYPSF|nr:hypothetical protein HYPSUDRAFT_43080 [Hypholoma sublateritium FD-334 SS-4]